jgi:LysR family transcriptional regulator, hca operon transcriptional activator
MELRQLRYFLGVAESMHFTRAAELLNVSQPALSQQIRLLEEEVGVRLLERTNRRVQLTPAGVAFRARVQVVLEEAAKATSDARSIESGEGGRLLVGFVSTAAMVVLPKILNRFALVFPASQSNFVSSIPGPNWRHSSKTGSMLVSRVSRPPCPSWSAGSSRGKN